MLITGIFVKLASYSMLKVARLSEKKYENDTKHAYDINVSTLNKIIEANMDTEFGRKYNFSSINCVSDFKNSIPLSSYDDYENYILRMAKGEKNILVKEEVKYFGISSGTTGKQKLIPVTKTSRHIASSYMGILPQRILYKNFKTSWSYGRGLAVTDMTTTSDTESGIPICSATSGGMKSIKRIIPLIWTTPVEVMNLGKNVDTMYLHLLFALKERNLMYISGIFISSVLDLFRYMELHWQELITDIRRGTINRRIEMEEASRKRLLANISPDAGRADFLEKEFKKGFKGIAKRIWPKLIYIIAVTGANFSIYDDKVAEYTDNLPIYSSAYAASEAVMGVNMHIDKYIYSLIPRTAFYEFIPKENIYDSNPITKNINELLLGEEYEIAVTNLAGLYRYRLGDVVKVVSYFNNCPEVQFLYRKNQLLNMVSEKTTEEHVLSALTNTFRKLKSSISDYTVLPDNSISPGKYIFFIEPKTLVTAPNIREINSLLDKELCKANLAYERQRKKNRLASAEVQLVSSGTFESLKMKKVQKGVSKSQVKIPRVLKSQEEILFFQEKVL
jgi:hypothetical protein